MKYEFIVNPNSFIYVIDCDNTKDFLRKFKTLLYLMIPARNLRFSNKKCNRFVSDLFRDICLFNILNKEKQYLNRLNSMKVSEEDKEALYNILCLFYTTFIHFRKNWSSTYKNKMTKYINYNTYNNTYEI